MNIRLVRAREVQRLTGLSRSSIFRRERDGDFPARRKIGSNSIAWIYEEIEAWIRSRQPASGQKRGNERAPPRGRGG